jgi:phosphatidylserine decarboxylase
MACFWRTPRRKTGVGSGLILSPADGKIIYIKKIDTGGIPVSLKDGKKSYLEELRKTYLLNMSLWHIGINMTLLDAHKNCAPISGKIIMNQHFPGKFLSLKNKNSQTENERNTYVIQNGELRVGIVQIASRIVRRIDSYVKQGESVGMGDWIGMIRFGSQVDIIVPSFCEIIVNPGEQVYAGITVLAKYTPAENTKTQAQRIDD